jgi:hypothetical protein
MLKQTLILVPANFSSEVIKNNDSSLIAAFLGLKTYAIGGCITNYKSEINNIAQFFGCSSKTVQYLIKDLIKEELAWVCGEDNFLFLYSKYCTGISIAYNDYLSSVFMSIILKSNMALYRAIC